MNILKVGYCKPCTLVLTPIDPPTINAYNRIKQNDVTITYEIKESDILEREIDTTINDDPTNWYASHNDTSLWESVPINNFFENSDLTDCPIRVCRPWFERDDSLN